MLGGITDALDHKVEFCLVPEIPTYAHPSELARSFESEQASFNKSNPLSRYSLLLRGPA
jgi:hypothetical protein